MNYQKLYDLIVERARHRERPEGYTEKHHIIPKSMGGTNAAVNIVRLSAKEHYVAHWLLFKTHKNKQMAYAWWCMTIKSPKGRRTHTSASFAKAREAKALFWRGATHPTFGKPISNEHKKKLSAAKLGKTYAEIGRTTTLKGRRTSQETKEKLRISSTGKTHSESAREKLRASKIGSANHRFGIKTSEEVRRKLSDAIKAIAHTRTNSRFLVIEGVSATASQWAKHPNCTVKGATIAARLREGWPAEQAIFTSAHDAQLLGNKRRSESQLAKRGGVKVERSRKTPKWRVEDVDTHEKWKTLTDCAKYLGVSVSSVWSSVEKGTCCCGRRLARIGLKAVEALECDQDSRNFTIEDLNVIKTHYAAKTRELKNSL